MNWLKLKSPGLFEDNFIWYGLFDYNNLTVTRFHPAIPYNQQMLYKVLKLTQLSKYENKCPMEILDYVE